MTRKEIQNEDFYVHSFDDWDHLKGVKRDTTFLDFRQMSDILAVENCKLWNQAV